MKTKLYVVFLALLVTGCGATRMSDLMIASGATMKIELLPEGGVPISDAQEAFAVIEGVAAEYQLQRYPDDERERLATSAETNKSLVFVRSYFLNTESLFAASEVALRATYSRPGFLEVKISDDTRWADSWVAHRLRYKIAHRLEDVFGGSRVHETRSLIYKAE